MTLVFTSCAQNEKKSQTDNSSQISAEDLKKRVEEGIDGVLLDIRTPGEVANGVIPGAKIIDFQSPEFKSELSKLDRDKTYYIYCHAGGRSAKAVAMMDQLGFTSVIEFVGGFQEWSAKGYPLIRK